MLRATRIKKLKDAKESVAKARAKLRAAEEHIDFMIEKREGGHVDNAMDISCLWHVTENLTSASLQSRIAKTLTRRVGTVLRTEREDTDAQE